ncbi:hypothetical protein MTBUT4_90124 [Magnetospirillum sp. UT-4]|nr:hypothetical protein MTBUT4_90124 [Magnetospirillum sp. UT-4]
MQRPHRPGRLARPPGRQGLAGRRLRRAVGGRVSAAVAGGAGGLARCADRALCRSLRAGGGVLGGAAVHLEDQHGGADRPGRPGAGRGGAGLGDGDGGRGLRHRGRRHHHGVGRGVSDGGGPQGARPRHLTTRGRPRG